MSEHEMTIEQIEEWLDLSGFDGNDDAALSAWASDRHGTITRDSIHELASEFYEEYVGIYDADEGMYGQLWATGYVEECLDEGLFGDIPESLRGHIDILGLAQDMELGGDIYTIEADFETVYVFRP